MNQKRVFNADQFSLSFKIASYVYECINYYLLKIRLALQYYYYADKKILDLINVLRFNNKLLLTIPESLQIYDCAKSALKIKGDFAEVGVYRGGSAKLISKVLDNRKLHLFDTFEGLPEASDNDEYFKLGEYSASLDEVRKLLKPIKNIIFYKGLFPKSSNKLKSSKFAFVHLDVDLFQSTKDSLEYFYPRMSKGGIILCHDYPISVGVNKAINKFFKDKPETVIKMVGNQALIVKY